MSIGNSALFFTIPELKTLHALVFLDGRQRCNTLGIKKKHYVDVDAANAWLNGIIADLHQCGLSDHPAFKEYAPKAYENLFELWSTMTGLGIEEYPYPATLSNGHESASDKEHPLLANSEKVSGTYDPTKEGLSDVYVAVLWNTTTGDIKFVSIAYAIADLTIKPKHYDPSNSTTKMILAPEVGLRARNYPITLYPENEEQDVRYTLVRSQNLNEALGAIKRVIQHRLEGEWSRRDMQDQFLVKMAQWIERETANRGSECRELLTKFAFEACCMIDGVTADIPGYCLIPNVDDPEYRKDLELAAERPYPKEIPDIGGDLHDRWAAIVDDVAAGYYDANT